jgi:lysophospholipase L1-like esterase
MQDRTPGGLPPWALNLAVLLGTCAVGLAGVEVFLQRYRPTASAAYQLDDQRLFRLIPNKRHLFTPLPGNGASVMVKTDAHGFRGDGISESRRGPRVVVYGDSFVEAEYSPLEETFVRRLQGDLRQALHQDDLETINAGVSAYGPDQSALRMEEEIDTLAPDLIVFCVFTGNDFGDLVRNQLFRLGPSGEVVESRPRVSAELQHSFAEAEQASHQPAVVRTVKAAWQTMHAAPLPQTFPHYIDEALATRRHEYDERGSGVVKNLLWDGYDADIALDPDSDSAHLKAALMRGVLARVQRTARAHGVPLLLVVIPDPVDVATPDFELQVDEAQYPQYDPRRLSSTVVQAAESLGLPYVDLYDTLTETPGERLFFRHGDNHWNAAGQAKAAAQVAAVLADRPMPLPAMRLAAAR